ncbi:MAG: cobalt-precorrin 5A hydrolase [Acetatifactor sp.]|nr:cobalt-precorrin 5A hydrolase [Acetatifactor sp.]
MARKIFEEWQEMIPQYRSADVSLEQWTGACFEKHLPVLFVGACGIAVRAIAPFVKDKLSDSAVLVMDEQGRFIIPILSGHVGGANALAKKLAGRMGAIPVLTTATDVEGLFSVDVFAMENGLQIKNRDGIRKVSAKLLRGEKVTITWEDGIQAEMSKGNGEERTALPEGLIFVPFSSETADVRIVTKQGLARHTELSQSLLLIAKEYVVGIGCKKGKTFEEFDAFLKQSLQEGWMEKTCAIVSIDLKAREEGIWELAQYYHLPFVTYPASELQKVQGEFTESEFVRETTGVANVCERAALCHAGAGGELIQKKTASQGMTVAVARRKTILHF